MLLAALEAMFRELVTSVEHQIRLPAYVEQAPWPPEAIAGANLSIVMSSQGPLNISTAAAHCVPAAGHPTPELTWAHTPRDGARTPCFSGRQDEQGPHEEGALEAGHSRPPDTRTGTAAVDCASML